MMLATTTRLAVILVLATTAAGQRSVWIVDPAGGAGSHYTSIQAAANAGQVLPGDVLQLRPGNHAPLATSKPLVLLGDINCLLPTVSISLLPAGTEFVIAGCTATPPVTFPMAGLGAWLTLTTRQGRVVIADVSHTRG